MMDISPKPLQKDSLLRAHLHQGPPPPDEDEEEGAQVIREPAEEFPILYRLLTAPKSVKPRNKDELFHMSISKREADSSSFWETSDYDDDSQVEDDSLPSSTTNERRSSRTGYYNHLLRRRLLMKRRRPGSHTSSSSHHHPPMTKLRSILTQSEDQYYHSRRQTHFSRRVQSSQRESSILEQLIAPASSNNAAGTEDVGRVSTNKCTMCDHDLTPRMKKDTILSRLLSCDGKPNSQDEAGTLVCRCPIKNVTEHRRDSSNGSNGISSSESNKYEEIIKILRRQPIISSNENPEISFLLASPHLGSPSRTSSNNNHSSSNTNKRAKSLEDGEKSSQSVDGEPLVLYEEEPEQNENQEIIIPVDYSKKTTSLSGRGMKRKRATEITVMNYKGKKLYPCSGFDCEQMFSSLDLLLHHLESHEESPDRIEKIQIHFN